MKDYLFLYGSLLPGLAPVRLRPVVDQLRLVGRASLPGRLYDLGRYPGAIFDASASTAVIGQVFELPDEAGVLATLDRYEGFDARDPQGSLYVRVRPPVVVIGGEEVSCWAYAYNRDPGTAPRIEAGDYLTWRAAAHSSQL